MNLNSKPTKTLLSTPHQHLGTFVAAGLAAILSTSVPAQQIEQVLPEVNVKADAEGAETGFVARKLKSATKSETNLFETPQSITVLTREKIDSQQANSLSEALRGVAGVSSGSFGRRGWDDFYIRGQRASESVYVDGLRANQSNWFSNELYGMEQVDILKGPATVNYGLVQPGGMVNLVTKRPKIEDSNEVSTSIGSYGFKQATFDMNRRIGDSDKAAFRLNGLISDQDDPTDYVYFKNKYIAPSLSLDLGRDTDLTLLSSYAEREYLRQQGVPVKGSVLANSKTSFSRSLFIGEPSFGPYESSQSQIGYALVHRNASGWTLQQNFRYTDTKMLGHGVFLGTLAANGVTQARTSMLQNVSETNIALDTNAEKKFTLGTTSHTVMVGLDLNRNREHYATTTCAVSSLNLNSPSYGTTVTCPATPTADNTTTISYSGIYLRDRIAWKDDWSLSLAARQDYAVNEVFNNKTRVTTQQNLSKMTGNAALMYQWNKSFAPYISIASSFLPQAGTDANGKQFDPEAGWQEEIGAKFQFAEGRIQANLARYDLTRQNVQATDPNNTSYSIQVGEQKTRGFETEISTDLGNGLSLTSSWSYTDARVTKDTTLPIGARLQNVPLHSASLWGNYLFRSGWNAGLGFRHEGSKTSPSISYAIPGYTVVDASLGYTGKGYKVLLNIKNLFNKDYYAGVLNNNVVPLGDPRTVMLKTTFNF